MTGETPGADSDRPSVAYERFGVTVLHGDCLDVLATLPDASVHAVVTDPPYGLGFMGKAWDDLPPGLGWAKECLRVLKPGGHLLAFGGSRTWHRLAVAIEDAGFEMRDSIAWLYGTGFPKSMDVSKAIDKAGGASPVQQAAVLRAARERSGLSREDVAAAVGCTISSVRDWEEGRSRAVGRPLEFITPSPDYRDKLADLLGYTADERSVVGVGGGSRGLYETGHRGIAYGDAATPAAQQWQGWGTALKPAFEPIVVARKPLSGTVAANVLEHGTGALNIDGTRVGTDAGRWPTNVVLDGDAADELDEQSGTLTSGANPTRRVSDKFGDAYGEFKGKTECTPARGADSGGASRFFPSFRWEAKAPTAERPRVNGVTHPTVKPIALMRWLVRLVTPPGGIVLDPFLGSGTTAQAARAEGFQCIGIERDPHYLELIRARLDARLQQSTPEAKGAPEVLDLLDLLIEDGAA